MLSQLLPIFNKQNNRSRQQTQREALVDLVTLFYQIDGRIKLIETDFVHEWLSVIDWQSNQSKEAYQNKAITRSREAIEANQISQFIATIVDRLIDDQAREEAFDLALEVCLVDDEFDELEVKAVNELREQLLKRDVRDESES